MALTGTDAVLAKKLFNSIKTKLQAKLGKPPLQADMLEAICEAIAEILVPHLVDKINVAPGIPVATTGGPGATTGPGTIL